MACTARPRLGILMMDVDIPRPPGDVGNPATWPFAVRYRRVRGITPEQLGHAVDPAVLARFVEEIQALASEGVDGILTSCGFLALYQRELSDAAGVPIATSALLQLPAVRAIVGATRPIGIITVDARSLSPAHLMAAGATDAREQPHRYPVAGLADGCHLQRVIQGRDSSLDTARAAIDVLEAATRLEQSHPTLAAVVLECANMPPYAAHLRAVLGLPVFDAVDLGRWFHAALPGAA